MKDKSRTKCHQIIQFDEEEKRLQLLIDESPIYLWLVAPWIIYVIFNVLISTIDVGNFTDALALGLSLLNYLFLLKLVSIAYLHIKTKLIEKSADEILIPPEKLSDISVFFLAFTAVYFGIIGIINGIKLGDWSSLEIAFLTLTLYAGFTVSLDELFDNGKTSTLRHRLTKPFRRTKLSASNVIFIALIVILSVLPNLYECALFAYLVIILIFLGVMKLLWKVRKKQLHLWGNNIAVVLHDKKTLIYQLGTDSAVKHELKRILMNMGVEIVNIDAHDLSSSQYDIVVILNSLIKSKQVLLGIKELDSVINDKSIIIDPFITKRKHRCILAAGFGLPNTTITGISLGDYISIIEN